MRRPPNNRLQRARLQANLTRAQLAEAVNDWMGEHTGVRSAVDNSHVGRWERGKHSWPRAHYREALRAILDSTDDELGLQPTHTTTHQVAITGPLPTDPTTAALVEQRLRAELTTHSRLIAATRLAEGADQLLARVVLDLGGRLHVVVPSTDHRTNLSETGRTEFDALLAQATRVQRLGFPTSNQASHLAARALTLARADQVIAINPDDGPDDGQDPILQQARERDIPVLTIRPGALLTEHTRRLDRY